MKLAIKLPLFLFAALTFSSLIAADEPDTGQMAPDFSIKQFDGSPFKLSDYRGKKAVYLVFWNTWCGYCMRELPKLKNNHALYKEQIKLIGINTSRKDSMKKSIAFQKKFKINYPLAFDYNNKVTDLYNVWGTPTSFIIDINGVVQFRDNIPGDIKPFLAQWNQLARQPEVAKNKKASCEAGDKTC